MSTIHYACKVRMTVQLIIEHTRQITHPHMCPLQRATMMVMDMHDITDSVIGNRASGEGLPIILMFEAAARWANRELIAHYIKREAGDGTHTAD